MKYKKLIAGTFGQRADNSTGLAFGLIVGLAAGAVMAMLFAPKSGKDLRSRITDKVRKFGQDGKDIYLSGEPGERGERGERIRKGAEKNQLNQDVNHAAVRKPKSDIKELLHGAHGAAHTEQGL